MSQAEIIIKDISAPSADITVKHVIIQGQLDESNIELKTPLIYSLIQKNPKNLFLLLDFKDLEYLNSKSIGYITDWYQKVTSNGGNIVIARPNEKIKDILTAVGMCDIIECKDSIEEAQKTLLNKK
jgi:anti-anti-sigma factor